MPHEITLDRFAAIVPAGGCGYLRSDVPKVLEELPNGRSIIGQVLHSLREVGLSTIVVVVNNYLFQEQIEEHLACENFGNHILYAHQHWRLGAAEAVAIGLEKLMSPYFGIFVTYADMPLWRPDTYRELMKLQVERLADVCLVTIPLTDKSPATVKRYGRVMRDSANNVIGVIEPGDSLSETAAWSVVSVNPSLYLFSHGWLKRNLCKIPPSHRSDGFPPEFYMPPLISIASHSVKIQELPLNDIDEALGVNTLEELEEVRAVFRKRASASAPA